MPTKKKEKNGDRYDVTGNLEAQYVDADELVMVNRKGITELKAIQEEEEDALAKAYEQLLREVRADTPMTTELLLHIHQTIFGDLYDWAGRWRTVRISKPGAHWPPPDFLDQGMQDYGQRILRHFPASALATDEDFCFAVSQIQGELLSIHPFREGNARAIKLLTDLLASQTGRPLLAYDMSEQGTEEYITSAKAALNKGDNSLFEPIILKALQTAIKPA